MSIKKRLNSMVIIIALGLATLIGVATHEMNAVYNAVNFSNVNVVPSILLLDDAVANFGRMRVGVYKLALNQDDSIDPAMRQSIIDSKNALQKSLYKYEKLIAGEINCHYSLEIMDFPTWNNCP